MDNRIIGICIFIAVLLVIAVYLVFEDPPIPDNSDTTTSSALALPNDYIIDDSSEGYDDE